MDISPRFCKILLFVLIALLCISIPAVAQDKATQPCASCGSTFKLASQDHLLGDWGGGRTELANRGVTFDFFFISDMFTNPEGGASQRASGWNRVRGTMNIDFGKLANIKGLTLWVTGLWQGGTNMGGFLGSIANPSGLVSAHSTRLDSFMFSYAMLNNKLTLSAGQFAGMDFYGIQNYGGNYLIEPIDYGFGARFQDYTSFDPASGPAAQIKIAPFKQVYFKVAVFSGNHNPYGDDTSGFGFTAKNNAVIADEVGYIVGQPNPSKDRNYPGLYEVGSTFNGGKFFTFAEAEGELPPTSANYQIYIMANQAIYRPVAHSNKGLDAHFGFLMTPSSVAGDVDTHTNTLDREITAGLIYTGLFPCRPKDSLNFGLVYSHVNSNFFKYDLTGTALTSEKAYEFNYKFQMTPYMYLQPVLTVYQDLGANPALGTGVLVGARFFIDF